MKSRNVSGREIMPVAQRCAIGANGKICVGHFDPTLARPPAHPQHLNDGRIRMDKLQQFKKWIEETDAPLYCNEEILDKIDEIENAAPTEYTFVKNELVWVEMRLRGGQLCPTNPCFEG